MGIGVSVFLITLGAILRFAITVDLEGIDLDAVGVILMIVGVFWLVMSLVLMRRRAAQEEGAGTKGDHHEPPAV